MEFYKDKLYQNRKQKRISAEKICKTAGIGRTTYWKWEKGHSVPNQAQVRMLGRVLDIKVSAISDLEDEYSVSSEIDYSGSIESWLSFINHDDNTSFKKVINESLKKTIQLSDKLDEAGLIIKALLSSIDSMFYIRDKNLKYITANDSFLRNVSLETTYKVYGKNDNAFFSKEEADRNFEQDEKVLITGKPISIEDCIPGSRKRKWGIISKTPVFDRKNNISGVIGNFIDITERKNAEKTRELLDISIEGMSDGITIFDYNKNKYVYINKSVEKIVGNTLKNFQKKGRGFWLDSVHPDDRKEQTAYFNKKTYAKTREFRIIRADGEIRWLEVGISDIKEFMNSKCVIAIVRDVTDRKKEEENRELLNIYLDESPIGIEIYNTTMNDKMVYANNSLAKIYERPLKSITTSTNFWLENCVHTDDRDREEEYLKTKCWPKIRQYRILTPSGKIKWLETRNTKKKIMGKYCNIGITSDISERKEVEKDRELLGIFGKNFPEGILIYNNENEYALYANDSFKKLYEFDEEEYLQMSKNGRKNWIETYVHSDDRALEYEYYKNKSWPNKREIKILVSSGKTKWVEIKRIEKKIWGQSCALSIVSDITDIKMKKIKAKNKLLDIAQILKTNNVELDIIAKATGLKESEING